MQKVKAVAAVVTSSKGKLGSLLGHSVISVMRACGKHGWTLPELKAAMEAHVGQHGLALMPKEHTMKLALKRGRDEAAQEGGAGGRKIAALSKKELEVLRVGEAPKAKGGKKGKGKAKKEAAAPEAQAGESDTDEAPELSEKAA